MRTILFLFALACKLQTAAYSSFLCAGTIDLNTLPTYVSSQGRPIHYVVCTSYPHTHFAYLPKVPSSLS